MKLSKKFVLRNTESGYGDGGMSFHDAGAAFASMDAQAEPEAEEGDDAAAERLASEDQDATHAPVAQADPAAASQEDDAITIEVDGKTVALKKADLPELYKGSMRQQDYTQKTMAAAEARKQADAEAAKTRQERDKYAAELNTFILTSSHLQAEQQKVLTDELLQSDPIEYLAQQRTFEKRQADLAKANAEMQRLQAEYQREQQEAGQQFLMKQREILHENFPEWKDPAKEQEYFSKLDKFMTERGFQAQDGRILLDARMLMLANDAMKYRELMERAKASKQKVDAAPPKVERPGVAQVATTDGRTAQMKKLAKTGSVRDAGDIFASFL